jgi:subtilisin-like proprotein convertase family protein
MRTIISRLAAVLAVVLVSHTAHADDAPSRIIHLNAGVIDTGQPATQARRQSVASFSGKRLHLIQLAGPIQPQWHADLIAAGLQIVDYIPDNTYLVYGDAAALGGMQKKLAGKSHVTWEGAYRAVDKIHPEAVLTPSTKARTSRPEPTLFAIQLVHDDVANAETLALIDALKLAPIVRQQPSAHYVNLVVNLPTDAIDGLAEQADIISIWPYRTPKKMDERQGIIVAGNLTGNGPSGAGYLAWLASKGFTQAQFNSSDLVVDVTDSGLDNGTTNINHFALYRGGTTSDISRVRYTRLEGTANSGSSIQGCDGHGNLNAHIIGGHVTLTNFPHTDSAGYRYGLGIAPFVKVGSSTIFDPNEFTFPDYDNLASRAYRDGARISGNSWGASTSGGYDVDAQNYDRLVRDAQPAGSAVATAGNQPLTFVFAAGNDGGSGAGTVGSPGTAKNVITVGAAENVHSHATTNGGNNAAGNDGCETPDSEANSANDVATFSSRGPCSDQRKKPDIQAPGTHITGGVGQNVRTMAGNGTALACFDATGVCALPGGGVVGNTNNFFPLGQRWYSTSSGTSHSTPAVAGGAALVYQWFINTSGNAPTPAMIKSFLMNSARYMTGTGANDTLYSNNQGMGMMNLGTAFDGTPRLLRDQVTNDLFTASGQSRTWTGSIVSNSKPFRVTVAWTDAPGSTSGNAYNNNLNLTVTVNGQTYLGNVFSGANSITGGSADPRNNVESVFLPAGTTGSVAITVTAANINSDGVPNFGGALDQDFALVAYNFAEVQAPVIAAAGAQLISESCGAGNNAIDPFESVTVALALQNLGTANTTNVVATLLSTGGVTTPSGAQSYGALLAAGAPVTNNFTFTASGVCGGSVTATLSLVDGATALGTVTYTFTLGGSVETTVTRTNSASIAINDNAAASPYPSSISVTGLVGTVAKVVVTLQGFTHTYPEDIDLILVGPGGQKIALMGAVGSSNSVSGLTLTFDDNAASQLGIPLTSGTWQPSGSVASMPGAAPAAPYGSALADFIGSTPNGTWSIYVADAAAGDTGSISGGWKIAVTAGQPLCCATNVPPVIAPIADQTVVVGANLLFDVIATDPADSDPITLTASNLPPSATFGSTNGIGAFQWINAAPAGVYTTRFFATDTDGTTIEEVIITCRTNEAPILAPIGNRFVSLSNTLTFAISATDPVGNDAITLSVSNLPAGATFGATNGTGTFNWPDAAPTGTYSVGFYAADIVGTNAEIIQITVAELPPFVTYAETFDITPNWGGGLVGSYNAKTYVNNATNPIGDGFSANSAVRDTTFGVTSNAWRLGNDSTANVYVRYALTNIVTRFAMQLARWDNSPTPRFEIRYSLDSGASYTTLFSTNGAWFTGDKVYQTYDSGTLNLIPAVGQQIYIELFRSTGERMLMDNFEVDYIPSGGAPAQTPPILAAIGAKSVTVSNTLSFAVTATPTDGDTVTLTASNLPAGAVFGSTNEIGTFTWVSAAPVGVYTSSFHATDNDGTDSETVLITVNASGGGGPSGAFTNILFQGFEAGDGWTIAAGSANISTNNGPSETPANQRIRTGTNSWQVSNGNRTLVLAQASIEGYTQRVVQVRNSSTSVTSGNGAEAADQVRVFVALDGAAFSAIADVIVSGNSNARWGYWATNQIQTTAGTLVSNSAPQAGTSTNNYANLFVLIPDSATSIALRVQAVNSDANEIWNIDDITVAGYAMGGAPVVTPGLVITTANQTVSFAVTNIAVGGTSTNLSGVISWTNSLSGGAGSVASAPTWLINGVALNVGTNVITVSGSNNLSVVTSAVVTIVRESGDTDMDGILDQWELDIFGSLTNANAISDSDGDNFIDLHEFLAGTEPTNSASFLFVDDSAVTVGGGIVIQWPGVTGKAYDLSRTTNLIESIYQVVATNIPGVSPMNTYTDSTPSVEHSIYRIELAPAP